MYKDEAEKLKGEIAEILTSQSIVLSAKLIDKLIDEFTDPPENPIEDVFTECIFDGSPPNGFVAWSDWAKQDVKKHVKITAIP